MDSAAQEEPGPGNPGTEAVEREVKLAWGSVIRRYRRWRGLSRRQLSDRAGLSTVYLGEIERGEKDPSSHSLALVAEALGVPLAELYVRVATHLDMRADEEDTPQPALPLVVLERPERYPEGVSPARDETAFDLYSVARSLRTDQQLALLMLARSLAQGDS
jgi:transcriptional regulator with XRE-family HTH domain